MTGRDTAAVRAPVVVIVAIAAPDDDGPCPCPEPAAGQSIIRDRQGEDR